MNAVAWHDLECGAYTADLPLWRELAAGPVLDVGAGTGRVALDLARRGHRVVALDIDAELLAELGRRAAGLEVETVCSAAEDLALPERFGSILVPMQTIQLMHDREAFLRAARSHLKPGGLLAAAIVEELEPFEGAIPPADTHGSLVSQPTAVRVLADVVRLERLRDDGRRAEENVIELARISAADLEAEGERAGFTVEPARHIPETDEHVSTTVVTLRG